MIGIFFDLELASQSPGECRVYLCDACRKAHPRPEGLDGGPLAPEDLDGARCDACDPAEGAGVRPYDFVLAGRYADLDYGEDDLRAWTARRRAARAAVPPDPLGRRSHARGVLAYDDPGLP